MLLLQRGRLARAFLSTEQIGRKRALPLNDKNQLKILLPCVILIAAVSASCSEENSDTKPRSRDVAIADTNCLATPPTNPNSMSKTQLWESYRHYGFCDYNKKLAIHYLDKLIEMDDTDAIVEKAVIIMRENKTESNALLNRAKKMGNSRAKTILENCNNNC